MPAKKRVSKDAGRDTLTEALPISNSLEYLEEVERSVLLDIGRTDRIGFPEIVLAEGKTDAELVHIIEKLAERHADVLVSRLEKRRYSKLRLKNYLKNYTLTYDKSSGTLLMVRKGSHNRKIFGRVALITAGTSDVRVAAETMHILTYFGVE
ncbi:MAG: hypothetical protein QXP70_00570, partial [Methanomassiliicoccales archaeon]